jgi:hypothetical protein
MSQTRILRRYKASGLDRFCLFLNVSTRSSP